MKAYCTFVQFSHSMTFAVGMPLLVLQYGLATIEQFLKGG